MMFLTSAIVALFVFGNLALGRPKDLQRAEKEISSTFWGRDVSATGDGVFDGDNNEVGAATNPVIQPVPSTDQYVAFGGTNDLIDTTDSTGLKPSTDANAPTDLNHPTDSTGLAFVINPSGDNDVATTQGESEPALDKSFAIAADSHTCSLGIPSNSLDSDSAAFGRLSDPGSSSSYVIYLVKDNPLDITVATEGIDTTWFDIGRALQHAGKGYAVMSTKKGPIGLVNLLEAPKMSDEAIKAYSKQGETFFDCLGTVKGIREVKSWADMANLAKELEYTF